MEGNYRGQDKMGGGGWGGCLVLAERAFLQKWQNVPVF